MYRLYDATTATRTFNTAQSRPHAHHVRQDVQHTIVERQWHRHITDGIKHFSRGAQRQSGGHSGIQAHGTIEKSHHAEIHPSTTGSTPRPRRRLTVFLSITQSASLASHCQQRRRITPSWKN